MPKPRRSLIGSFSGDKILLITPLLKWYLAHGLEVTKIYQVIEYTPERCFQPFGEAESEARRAGDADPNKSIIADTMKLVGNSSYGKTITNQENHRDIRYCSDIQASRLINEPYFPSIEPTDDDTYEVQSCKKSHQTEPPLPYRLFFVYQNAKR